MKQIFKNSSIYFVVFLILLACCADETEAVRRVLRGRRTLTRQYFVGIGIPPYILIALLGVGEVLIGVALYFILQRVILYTDTEKANTYAPAPATENDV